MDARSLGGQQTLSFSLMAERHHFAAEPDGLGEGQECTRWTRKTIKTRRGKFDSFTHVHSGVLAF